MTTLVMDNDSTTIARLMATVGPHIKKKSYINHTKKGFTGSLVDSQQWSQTIKESLSENSHWSTMFYIRSTVKATH